MRPFVCLDSDEKARRPPSNNLSMQMLVFIVLNLRNEDRHLASSLQVFQACHRLLALVLHNNPVERLEWVRPWHLELGPIRLPILELGSELLPVWVRYKAQALEPSRHLV
jgi:hypothetical protein